MISPLCFAVPLRCDRRLPGHGIAVQFEGPAKRRQFGRHHVTRLASEPSLAREAWDRGSLGHSKECNYKQCYEHAYQNSSTEVRFLIIHHFFLPFLLDRACTQQLTQLYRANSGNARQDFVRRPVVHPVLAAVPTSFRDVENWRNGDRLGVSLWLLAACLFLAQLADIRNQIVDLCLIQSVAERRHIPLPLINLGVDFGVGQF